MKGSYPVRQSSNFHETDFITMLFSLLWTQRYNKNDKHFDYLAKICIFAKKIIRHDKSKCHITHI